MSNRSALCKSIVKVLALGFFCALPPLAVAQVVIDHDVVEQVQRIAQSVALQDARRNLQLRREKTNAQMVQLTELPAPPFAEDNRAALFTSMLREAGVDDVKSDATGNVIGRIRGQIGARRVAVVAHLDSVFPIETDVKVKRDGDVYRAPGVGDNARGVAMLLALGEVIVKSGVTLQDDLLLIGSVGEEGLGDLRGMRAVIADEARAINALIAIDGGQTNRLVTTAVGSNRYRVTFVGPGGHSYGQFGRGNPHHALADAIAGFTQRAAAIVDAADVKATYSVGRIGGGTAINAIAFESWMEVDMRSADADSLQALDSALRAAVADALDEQNAARSKGDPLTVSVTSVGRRPAGTQDVTLGLIQRAMSALRIAGIEPQLSASSTDANVAIAANIPAVTISRGGISRNAHALNESWQDTNTLQSEWAALLLIAAEAGLD
ncbi:MAG: M20/M25/M40 family metallo-hydrolase [Pseudomonadota bacterium]